MSSTMLPVETRFVETVLMFVVNVCPVVTRLLLVVLKFDVRVEISLSLLVSAFAFDPL